MSVEEPTVAEPTPEQSAPGESTPGESTMEEHSERLFAAGIALGTAVGIVLGSVIALRVGESRLDTMRRAVARAIGREERPKLELLLQ